MDPTLFSDDWKEFLALLRSNKVKHLLIGGMAVILHGYSRATKDLDVWVENLPGNIAKLKRALIAFGFKEMADGMDKTMEEREVKFIGRKPYRIDVLSGISGLKFADAYRNRVVKLLDGLELPVAGIDDLIVNKLASGRHKDLADVEALKRLRELMKKAQRGPAQDRKAPKRRSGRTTR